LSQRPLALLAHRYFTRKPPLWADATRPTGRLALPRNLLAVGKVTIKATISEVVVLAVVSKLPCFPASFDGGHGRRHEPMHLKRVQIIKIPYFHAKKIVHGVG
jgi:hypothetical protein